MWILHIFRHFLKRLLGIRFFFLLSNNNSFCGYYISVSVKISTSITESLYKVFLFITIFFKMAYNVPPLLVSCELRNCVLSAKIRFSSGKSTTGLSKIRNCEKRLLGIRFFFLHTNNNSFCGYYISVSPLFKFKSEWHKYKSDSYKYK